MGDVKKLLVEAKAAKFKFEYMAMMLLAGRDEKAAEAYESGIWFLEKIIGEIEECEA